MDTNDSHDASVCFTLRQLLGGDLTLVIPDMQRDYCWGTKSDPDEPEDKVTIFVSGLVYMYIKRRITPLGLLYGYEEPAGSNHILIIDGQQRLTTLYLLIGMLFRRTPTPELRRLLISDYKLIDDRQPRLLYQVRSNAMYFMSDLVTNFFLDRDGRLSEIERCHWYYRCYDSDPTIQSFIGAIRRIDDVLERVACQPQWDFADFAEYITDRLQFIYHDLGEGRRAQKAFITINTTGEPLTLPQNYKSLLVAISGGSEQTIAQWEEMEQWAWLHRDKSDPDKPRTSDALLERYLRLWTVYRAKGDMSVLNPTLFAEMYSYFCLYRKLVELIPEAINMCPDSPADSFLLLPAIEYIRKWSPVTSQGVADLWAFLSNILRYTRVSASGSDADAAVKLIGRMSSPDITSLLDTGCVSDKILNSDARSALSLMAQYPDERLRVSRIIDRAQCHPMLNGRIRSIVAWCTDRDGTTDLDRLDEYIDCIYTIWGNDINECTALDHLRRALLTLRHTGYPIVRRGDTMLSLCWRDYDWQRLMISSPGLIRMLIDRVRTADSPPIDTLKRMAAKFDDRSSPYFFIIKSPSLLKRCQQRMLIRPCPVFMGFYLHDDDDMTSTMCWFIDQLPLRIDIDRWTTMRPYGSRCLYTDHRVYDLAVDLYYTPGQKYAYRIDIFSRLDDGEKRIPCNPPEIAKNLGIPISYDKRRKRHYTLAKDARTAAALIDKLCALI